MKELIWKVAYAYAEAVALIVIAPMLFMYRVSKDNSVVCRSCYNAIAWIKNEVEELRLLVYEEIIPGES